MSQKGMIFDIKRFAVHDGDGIRTTVFFKGCSLKCVWCHNPEGISFRPELAFYENRCSGCGRCAKVCDCHTWADGQHTFQASACTACGQCEEACFNDCLKLYGREYTVDELVPILLQDELFYDNGGGITLSGGECLCQPEFCRELLKACKEKGLNTAVDTCGNVPFESIAEVLPYTDTFLYDIKAMDEEVHKKRTGASNKRILENLDRLEEAGASVEIRIPYVPGYNDSELPKIAVYVNGLKCVKKVRVLPYHNYAAGKYAALGMVNTLPETLPTTEEIEAAEKLFDKESAFTKSAYPPAH